MFRVSSDHSWIALRMLVSMVGVFIFLKLALITLSPENFVLLTLSVSIINLARTLIISPFENQGPVELSEIRKPSDQESYYIHSIQCFQCRMIFLVLPLILIATLFFNNLSLITIIFLFASLVIELLTPNFLYYSQRKFFKLFVISIISPFSNLISMSILLYLKSDSLEIFAIIKFILVVIPTSIIIPKFFIYIERAVKTKKGLNDLFSEQKTKLIYVVPSKFIITVLIEAPTFYLSQVGSISTFIAYDIFRKITEAFKQVVRVFNTKQLVDKKIHNPHKLITERSKLLIPLTIIYALIYDHLKHAINDAAFSNFTMLAFGACIIYFSGISGTLGSLIILKLKKLKAFFYSVLLGILPWASIFVFEITDFLLHALILVTISELMILLGRFYYVGKIQKSF